MAVTKVQRTEVQGNGLLVSTTTPAFGSSTTTGNSIVVFTAVYDPQFAPTHTVTDSKSNTYTRVASRIEFGSSLYISQYVCHNATGGASHTVTFTTNGGSGSIASIIAYEVSGSGTLSTDASATNNSSGTSASVTVTSTAAGLLLAMVSHNASGTITPTTGTEDTEDESASSEVPYNVVRIAVASSGANTPAWTVPSSVWGAVGLAIKESGGGGDTTPPTISAPVTQAGGTTTTATLSESGCVFDDASTSTNSAAGFAFTDSRVISNTAISGTTITWTHGVVRPFDSAATLAYDRSTTTKDVKDGSGNYLANFTGTSVTNSSKNFTVNASETVTLTQSYTGITNISIGANAVLDGSATLYNVIADGGTNIPVDIAVTAVLKRMGTTRTRTGTLGSYALTDDDANYAMRVATTGAVSVLGRWENCSDAKFTLNSTATGTFGGKWGMDGSNALSSRVTVRSMAGTSHEFLYVTGNTSGAVKMEGLTSRRSYALFHNLSALTIGGKSGSVTDWTKQNRILGLRAGLQITSSTFSAYGTATFTTHDFTGAAEDDDGGLSAGSQVNNFYTFGSTCTESWDCVFYKGQWISSIFGGTMGAAGHPVVLAGLDSHAALQRPQNGAVIQYVIIAGPDAGQADYQQHVAIAESTFVTLNHVTLIGDPQFTLYAMGVNEGGTVELNNTLFAFFNTDDAKALVQGADGPPATTPFITAADYNGWYNPASTATKYGSAKVGGGTLGAHDKNTDPGFGTDLSAGVTAHPYTEDQLAADTYDAQDVLDWYVGIVTPTAVAYQNSDSLGTGTIGAVPYVAASTAFTGGLMLLGVG